MTPPRSPGSTFVTQTFAIGDALIRSTRLFQTKFFFVYQLDFFSDSGRYWNASRKQERDVLARRRHLRPIIPPVAMKIPNPFDAVERLLFEDATHLNRLDYSIFGRLKSIAITGLNGHTSTYRRIDVDVEKENEKWWPAMHRSQNEIRLTEKKTILGARPLGFSNISRFPRLLPLNGYTVLISIHQW